jgi:hypothetical protein
MKEANKQIKEIINKFNIQPSKLMEVKYVNSNDQKRFITDLRNNFINFIRCWLQ